MSQSLTVCYMGITKPSFSRSGVQIPALRKAGVTVHECFDQSPGPLKFWRLYRKHAALKGRYDAVIVAYPGAVIVPLARLISRKPIIFDAGWTMYEGIVLARGRYAKNPLGRYFVWLIDRTGYAFAHRVLLDTDEQIPFYASLLKVPVHKLHRVYTGCNEEVFRPDPDVTKRSRFTAAFRGKHNLEAGLPEVIAAGRLLATENIDIRIYSPGYEPEEPLTPNITVEREFLAIEELRLRMLECHVSIGQMADNDRLNHSIPHKAFESLSLGLPYIAARSKATAELLTDGESCLMVAPADPKALANALRRLHDEPGLMWRLSDGGRKVYEEKASWDAIGTELVAHVRELR